MSPTCVRIGLALAALMVLAPMSQAAEAGGLFAAGSYWDGFKDFWLGTLRKSNGIVLFAVGLGLVCVFILTRGKWKKA